MRYEYWEDELCGSYFPVDENYQQCRKLLGDGAKLVWVYDARSKFDAMRAYHQYRKWEPYQPEPDWEDEFYDE